MRELDTADGADKDIARLQITMNQALLMRMFKPIANLYEKVDCCQPA
jgi:hypothetical protein